MKKVFFASILTMGMYFVSSAQTTFGVHANGIASSLTEKYEEAGQTEEMKGTSRISWKIGGVAMVPLSKNFSFMPQLNIVSKGTKMDESYTETEGGVTYTVSVEGTAKLSYIEMPLNFVYNTSSFFIGAGPSLSYGLGGNTEGKTTFTQNGTVILSEESENDVKFDGDANSTDDKEHFKAFEFGANITAGYKFTNGLFINAQYNLGLSNISPYENTTTKNKYFGVGIGYFFSK